MLVSVGVVVGDFVDCVVDVADDIASAVFDDVVIDAGSA